MVPKREVATRNGQTYFVTSNSASRKAFFRNARWAELFIETLYAYRTERFRLHSFVLMPDHFHLLITPTESLERAVQCIKGGFSFRAKKQLGWSGDIWISGFSDHRIRDFQDLQVHQRYIATNPVKSKIVLRPEEYLYSSASGRFELDEIPQGLKPVNDAIACGAAKAAPFQNSHHSGDDLSRLQNIKI
jgi:putative transposase